jgi:hypothetical protein
MNNCKNDKENIKKKIDEGIFKTCAKSKSATASWWNNFVRIKDDKEKIIPFIQCIKCLSILVYESSKTGSSTHRSHAQTCLGGGPPSTSKNQNIISMMNKENHVPAATKRSFTEACAAFCSYDLRPFETVNGHGFEILCQTLLDIAYNNPCRIEAANIIPDPTTISRRVKSLAEGMRN